ncbi:MAG: FecR domain-containing protein [Tannerella sp.]|jgi:ferric-dicitrate binding protein FerR (iron transport regulator)|nr:FecR domain-containing protein [Tannerella sp.]
MERNSSINSNEESPVNAYYREEWENASGTDMPSETKERIFRAIRKRMKGEVFRLAPAEWVRYAAAVFAGAIVCMGIHLLLGRTSAKQETASGNFTVFADKGQRSNITLPDGTRVWLNSHSKITYPCDYGVRERALSLTGEAYFEVAKDPEKRFLVKTGDMKIEALGTSFNVKAYDEDGKTVTTLFDGSVQATVGNKTIKIAPDEYVAYNSKSRSLTYGDAENAAYAAMWRNNELVFNRQTLDEIAVIFNRLYNIHVQFESKKIRNYRFSGVIKNNSLDNAIEIISLTAPILYKCKGDTIILSERKKTRK